MDDLYLTPVGGDRFDVARIREYLERRPDVLIDPLGTGKYMMDPLFGASGKKYLGEARLAKPSQFPYRTLIEVRDDMVGVYQEYSGLPELASPLQFVDWLLGQYRCRVQNGYGTDVTEQAARGGARALYYNEPEPRPTVGEWQPDWLDPLPALGPRMVVEYPSDAASKVDPACVAWRVEWPDSGGADRFAGTLEQLLDTIGADNLRALVVGVYEDQFEEGLPPAELAAAVSVLLDAVPRLTSLTGLALFDMVIFGDDDAVPFAWRTPVDATALLRAFPQLEILHVCGDLRLEPVRHDRLRRLWVHSAAPCDDAAQALTNCEFAAMESRHVTLGATTG
ncbi:hypothetical protein AB0M79_35235 [Polymorphospora sp. NPDC051019]|uniref:hypothetical protein n=1 Tax=Polymorphospora sp. NPDC051019 TaxID=3155725 RepID=UPI0034424B20